MKILSICAILLQFSLSTSFPSTQDVISASLDMTEPSQDAFSTPGDMFIYRMETRTGPSWNRIITFRCFASQMMINRMVLMPASCLDNVERTEFWADLSRLAIGSLNYQIHPLFDRFNPNHYNVGRITNMPIITTSWFNVTARHILDLPQTTRRCQIQYWTGRDGQIDLVNVDVDVHPPSVCGNDTPHTHCTFVQPADVANVCQSLLGAPLVCDEFFISGFVISRNGCDMRNGTFVIRYNSVSLYNEWMQMPTTTTTVQTTSVEATTSSTTTTTQGASQLNAANFGFLLIIFVIFKNF